MSAENTGTLYLIPIPLASGALHTLSPETIQVIHSLKYFVVENARTARRFIKATNPPYAIDSLQIAELDKHELQDTGVLLDPLLKGHPMGIMSEAGCPGIADPGNILVQYAHQHEIRVIPLTGPSSILLALMASGLEGQRFQFHGYLSPKAKQLRSDLKLLEANAYRDRTTQIFIETPYRNKQVLEVALQTLSDQTALCIAVDLTAPEEWIRTRSVAQWKTSQKPDLHKRPAVFCIGAP